MQAVGGGDAGWKKTERGKVFLKKRHIELRIQSGLRAADFSCWGEDFSPV